MKTTDTQKIYEGKDRVAEIKSLKLKKRKQKELDTFKELTFLLDSFMPEKKFKTKPDKQDINLIKMPPKTCNFKPDIKSVFEDDYLDALDGRLLKQIKRKTKPEQDSLSEDLSDAIFTQMQFKDKIKPKTELRLNHVKSEVK